MEITDQIKQEALKIANETQPGANTAQRIGNLFAKIAQALEQTKSDGTKQQLIDAFNQKAGKPFSDI